MSSKKILDPNSTKGTFSCLNTLSDFNPFEFYFNNYSFDGDAPNRYPAAEAATNEETADLPGYYNNHDDDKPSYRSADRDDEPKAESMTFSDDDGTREPEDSGVEDVMHADNAHDAPGLTK